MTTTWNDQAACKGAPLEIFFPPADAGRGSLDRARAYCNACPVKGPCLDRALELNWREDEGGMYGGTTFRERRQIRREIRLFQQQLDQL